MRAIHSIVLPFVLALLCVIPLSGQQPRPAAGMFLVALPELQDPNFAHSVVLLFDYGEHGAAGVIVNRPTEARLEDLLPDVEGGDRPVGSVYLGGPVLPQGVLVLMRAASAPEEAREVFDDVYVSADRDLLDRLVKGDGTFRVYAGYAGWGAGQLDWEIRRGSWALVPADVEAVFGDDPEAVWRKMLRRATSPLASLPPAGGHRLSTQGPRRAGSGPSISPSRSRTRPRRHLTRIRRRTASSRGRR